MSVVGLGQRIDTLQGIPYSLPGFTVLGAITTAFENAALSIVNGRWNEYSRCRTTHELCKGGSV